MNKEEIQEALKIIREPIIVNNVNYKYFDQENYDKLVRAYENCQWFINNWEQLEQNIEDLQKKIKELEKGIKIKEYNRNTLYTAVTEIAKTLRIEDYENWNFDLILDKIEKLQKQAMLGKSYKKLYGSVKKQKNDVIEYVKNNRLFNYFYDEEELFEIISDAKAKEELLRMLGETDE